MRKFIITAVSALAITGAVAGTASAAAPNGDFAFKHNVTYDQGNLVGKYSSQITQNGQFVSGQDNDYGIDQTATPGSRADAVQALLTNGLDK